MYVLNRISEQSNEYCTIAISWNCTFQFICGFITHKHLSYPVFWVLYHRYMLARFSTASLGFLGFSRCKHRVKNVEGRWLSAVLKGSSLDKALFTTPPPIFPNPLPRVFSHINNFTLSPYFLAWFSGKQRHPTFQPLCPPLLPFPLPPRVFCQL